IWPSKAKNALASMRSYLRLNHAGRTLVFLDAKTVLPTPLAMRGVRFRLPLSRPEAERGVVFVQPGFAYFLRREIAPEEAQFLDSQGRPLLVEVTTVREEIETFLGPQTVDFQAFDLGHWLREQGVRPDDSLLVTIEDWERGVFRLEYEPAQEQRQDEIARQDRELADLLFELLESKRYERVFGMEAIPTAYARLSDPGGYPGNHWLQVVYDDARIRYDGSAICYSDFRSPLERMLEGDRPIPQQSFSPAQGRQVYRFKAALKYRSGLWRQIEIQGKQTLADFDRILRDAFEHDTYDHMGGFWRRIRRGKGRRFREVELGDINPWGEGSGAEVQIAGLGLQPGDELKYVYDFGDWIEHRLTLEEIVEPEAGGQYPRITAQNKPRYRYCETCKAEGRQSRATWICIECSNEQQRQVLVCEECLSRDHEDHFADKILY
ncbi:MAG TPA: hypothetical protein ENJ31_06195, partial [Anaerolineae bacterium]|nr:hypothetical protein [Anaerolineae bacterium]